MGQSSRRLGRTSNGHKGLVVRQLVVDGFGPPSRSGYCVVCVQRSSVRQRSSPTVREGPIAKTEFHQMRCEGLLGYNSIFIPFWVRRNAMWDSHENAFAVPALADIFSPAEVGTTYIFIVLTRHVAEFMSTAIHKCGYVSNGRKKSFDRITGFTGFFPKTQEESC